MLTAIYHYYLASNARSLFGREKEECMGDIHRLAHAAQGDMALDLLEFLWGQIPCCVRERQARFHGIDSYSLRAKLDGGQAHECVECRLAGSIDGKSWLPLPVSCYRRDDQNRRPRTCL